MQPAQLYVEILHCCRASRWSSQAIWGLSSSSTQKGLASRIVASAAWRNCILRASLPTDQSWSHHECTACRACQLSRTSTPKEAVCLPFLPLTVGIVLKWYWHRQPRLSLSLSLSISLSASTKTVWNFFADGCLNNMHSFQTGSLGLCYLWSSANTAEADMVIFGIVVEQREVDATCQDPCLRSSGSAKFLPHTSFLRFIHDLYRTSPLLALLPLIQDRERRRSKTSRRILSPVKRGGIKTSHQQAL